MSRTTIIKVATSQRSAAMLAFAAAMLLCSGCVTGRRIVPLTPELGAMSNVPAPRATVLLESVSDARDFQNQPRDPSTPSVKGDVNTLSSEDRSRAIARQRNGFGKAIGDVFLPDNQTVEQLVEQMITDAFARNGLTVVKSPTDGEVATVSAEITEFWGWMTPAMFTVPFEAHVEARITLAAGDAKTTLRIQGIGRNQGQVASNANWQVAYNRAFADFQEKLQQEVRDWAESTLSRTQ